MNINEEVTLSNLWWNNGLRGFLFRDQATETLEELVSAVGGNSDSNAFYDLEERVEQNYADVEDFEEDCYNETIEYLLENLGYDIAEEDDEEDIEGCGALVTALQPRYDSRASFYGKAQVVESEDGTVLSLVSYDTTVATFDRLSGTLDVFGYYSATTARHIREFAKQLGITLPKGSDIKGRYQI